MAYVVSVVNDCEKLLPDTVVGRSNVIWDAKSRTIRLHAAKNEVVAFQIVLRSGETLRGGDVLFSDLAGPGKFAADNFAGFLELYQRVTRSEDSPGDWPIGVECPDPLVPLHDPYAPRGKRAPVAAPFEVTAGRNTIVWVDCWAPPETRAGDYRGTITVTIGGKKERLNVRLTVWDFVIPAESHIFNFTETYRWQFEYHEKAEYGFGKSGWRKMKRYDELFLQHRLQNCLTRLWPDLKFARDGRLVSADWAEYDKYAGARLNGTFVKDGPSKGSRPPLWYFQFYPFFPNDPEIKKPTVEFRLKGKYEENVMRTLAREVARHWKAKGWTTPIAAAILDESTDWETIRWGARILHEEGGDLFKYMNTGHYGVQPQLIGYVDIWAPNAQNYDPCSMVKRHADGDMSWFYHWCEPFMGHMTINTCGVSMRVWDAAAFKYGVDGTFLWTANNWPHPRNWVERWGPLVSPYVSANGKNGGARFGNGTYVYPGAGLPDAGFRAINGPVPSMRLKVMRRGAQDYEYLWMLRQKGRYVEQKARKILSKVLRSALMASANLGHQYTFTVDPALPWTEDIEAEQGDWSHRGEDWVKMRLELGELMVATSK